MRTIGSTVLLLALLGVACSGSSGQREPTSSSSNVPPFDPVTWFSEHGLVEGPVSRPQGLAAYYGVGDSRIFTVVDLNVTTDVEATLVYMNRVVAMWVESGVEVDAGAIASAADRFADDIYPTVRDYFGEEWSPGIDNDRRLHILHVPFLEGAAGQYNSTDEYAPSIYPESNQAEMFYISLADVEIGTDLYLAALAHEFQHMIQWNVDPNESSWADEGLAQLAERLVGFDFVEPQDFLARTDTQLNSWGASPVASEVGNHYGAGYLFMLYFWERAGDDAVRLLSRSSADSLEAVDAVLVGLGGSLDGLFSDWIVANYLDDTSLGDGRYGYENESLTGACPRQSLTDLPAEFSNTLPQYSAHYIELAGDGDFVVEFSGATRVGVIGAPAHGGEGLWWSGRGDLSNMTLTRAFDLYSLSSATLEFWTWYDIEDYADQRLVSVSIDDGETWEILDAPSTTFDPEFDEYPFYTGVSGSSGRPEWISESIDLSQFAGGEVLVRFEYVTDAFFTRSGWALDDISIPELDYIHDAEGADDGWIGRGFIRTSSSVAQNWGVHLIRHGTPTDVRELTVDEDGTASVSFSHVGQDDRSTLVLGAMAPITKVPASYQLSIDGRRPAETSAIELSGNVLFADDFTDPCGGWFLFDDSDQSARIEDGQLTIEAKSADWQTITGPRQSFGDVEIDVDVDMSGLTDDGYVSVLCRENALFDSYQFDVTADGFFAIWASVGGELEALRDYTSLGGALNRSPAGGASENHLTVACVGETLSVSLNGQLLAEVEDSRLTAGAVGLSVGVFEVPGAVASFDNVVVHVSPPNDVGYADDFSDESSGWEVSKWPGGSQGYDNGRYFIDIDGPDIFAWSNPNEEFTDVIIDVDTILQSSAGDNNSGVICRYRDDRNYYLFEIDAQGFYSISAFIARRWEVLSDWTASESIRTGVGAQNHLRIECIGDTLGFAVNGELLVEIQDDRLADGNIGLSASTYSRGGARVLFDNVQVRQPTGAP